jgi:hypothetical protein
MLLGIVLVPAFMSGKYGFTSKMATGSFAEYLCILCWRESFCS